jgi:hypothetical protein
MTNCFKIKKHWFLIIGMMLLLSNYCVGQTFLSVPDSLVKPNGRPFIVRLNPTSSIAEQCTSQTITLNIGALTYLPGSNGPLPAGIVITPVTNSGETILTISGIINDGKQGSSLTMDIAMQFKPGTCDGVTQLIKATTVNIGCTVPSNQLGSVTVTSLSPNNGKVELYLSTSGSQPFCPRKIIRHTVYASNYGNQGFNLGSLKLHLEVDKCATVMGVYKYNTYVSVNPVITSGSNSKIVEFDVPDLLLSVNSISQPYDIYIVYPCLNGNNDDCTSGIKYMTASLIGKLKDCDIPFATPVVRTSHQITTSTATCGNVSCVTGGSVGEIEGISVGNYAFTFSCPNACMDGWGRAGFQLNIPPFNPSFTNRVATIDIPAGLNVSYAFVNNPNSCDTPFIINYIDAQGNKKSTPFGNSLTRKVEFITDCTISSPQTFFLVDCTYDKVNPPLAGSYLPFDFTYTSDGKKIIDSNLKALIETCNSNVSLIKQVRKASQLLYENNYNASAVPGELMTYRQEISNLGIGDSNNIITDKIDNNLVYEGGFKYAYETNAYSTDMFFPLLGKSSFTLPELGTVNVSTPAIGQSGTVTLSGFNFPCTNKRLYIEYNVRVKNNVIAGTKIPNLAVISGSADLYYQPQTNYITIAAFTYVKNKMFVKCALANEWNESGINVKNGEVVDFKMQFSNAGSNPIVLSELINLRPQAGDLFEFGSNSRNSNLNINYNCDLPSVFTNMATAPSVVFKYALNSPTMNRDLCPPQTSGNTPNWQDACNNTNWLKATFPTDFKLLPGDYVEIVYKGKITGTTGTAYNSFAFKVGGCEVLSANSNTLAITNDNIGIGCNSCTLTNPYSTDMKNLFENLLKNILTRKINGETDAQINGSNPAELIALKPYITNGGGTKIYNFVSTVNAQNKITSIKFSFAANSENDVSFFEEKGLNYNPEVGAVDPSYLRIDTTLYASADQYLTTCRKTVDENGNVISDCVSKTQVRHIDFCPTRFCYPMSGEIKTGN